MTCYKPNFIVKNKLRYIDYLSYRDNPERVEKQGWKVHKTEPYLYQFVNSESLKFKDYFIDFDKLKTGYELCPIPCGQCIGCRLDYSRDWACRCMLESSEYKFNYFLTLTYRDEDLPVNGSLQPKDLELFMKRFRITFERKYNIKNIRFFACGEYGSSLLTERPHYHIILFNCPIPDLSSDFHYLDDEGRDCITRKVVNGNIYYWSQDIFDIWNKGNIVIGDVSYQSCAYVARYVVKKQKGKSAHVYEDRGMIPPFCRMSMRPGIGAAFYNSNKDFLIENDKIYLCDGKIAVPPRFYMNMLKIDNEFEYYRIKEKRKNSSDENLRKIYNSTNLHYDDYIELLENCKERQISSLTRCL